MPSPASVERDYRLIFLASLAATLAGSIAGLAIPLSAVTLLHAGPLQMGLLAATELLPFALFSLPAGPWIDRSRKKPLGIGFNLLAASAALVVPLAYAADRLTLPVFYLVGFIVGTCSVIGGSATQVQLTQVVGRERLVAVYARMTAAQSVVSVLGPVAAALLVARFEAPRAVAANALLFLLAALLLARVRRDDAPAAAGGGHWWPEALDGLRLIRNTPLLRAMAIFGASWLMLLGGFGAQFVLFSMRELHLDANGLAFVGACSAVGAVAGALAARRFEQRHGARAVMLSGFLLSAVGMGLYAAAGPWASAAVVLGFAAGTRLAMEFGVTLYTVNYVSLRHRITPDAMLGRVTATMRGIGVSAAPVGALVWSVSAEWVGIAPTLLLISAAGIVLWWAATRHMPRVD